MRENTLTFYTQDEMNIDDVAFPKMRLLTLESRKDPCFAGEDAHGLPLYIPGVRTITMTFEVMTESEEGGE